MTDTPDITKRHIRSYVLRQGRVTVAQQRAVDTMQPVYGITYAAEPLALDTAFGRSAPKILEIGFGMGDSTATIAKDHPENDYLCLEVHTPGVGNLFKVMDEQQISNIRIIQHDAVEVLRDMIADASLDGVHIFFPDPWHKARHNKRRLIQGPFITKLMTKLKPACPELGRRGTRPSRSPGFCLRRLCYLGNQWLSHNYRGGYGNVAGANREPHAPIG